jgi:hypothetical protein
VQQAELAGVEGELVAVVGMGNGDQPPRAFGD